MPIFCNNCIEYNNVQSKEFNILSHGIVKCVFCGTHYKIKVDKIVITQMSGN